MQDFICAALEKWGGHRITFGTQEYTDMREDMNVMIKERDKLKRFYSSNKDIVDQLSATIRSLAGQVVVPKSEFTVKKPVSVEPEYKPENFMSERQKKLKERMDAAAKIDAERKKQQNMFQ